MLNDNLKTKAGLIMDAIKYKGYTISAAPQQRVDTNEWTININIYLVKGDETSVKSFFAGDSYKTREEAIIHCFNFGRLIIDGKASNCTVEGL